MRAQPGGSGPLHQGDGSWPGRVDGRLQGLESRTEILGKELEFLGGTLEETRGKLGAHDQLLRGPDGVLMHMTRAAGLIESHGSALDAAAAGLKDIEKKIDGGKTWLIVLLVGTLVTKGVDWALEATKRGLLAAPTAAQAKEHR